MASILIIEDNDDLREVLVQLLMQLGCDVRGAGSARAGLTELEQRDVDLVITDWMLGDDTGGAVLRAADAAGALVGVRAIIYSSSIEAEAPPSLPHVQVVPKSRGVEALLTCVSRLLPAAREQDACAWAAHLLGARSTT